MHADVRAAHALSACRCVLTQIVMDHCDKGSLLQAIKRGLFRWGGAAGAGAAAAVAVTASGYGC